MGNIVVEFDGEELRVFASADIRVDRVEIVDHIADMNSVVKPTQEGVDAKMVRMTTGMLEVGYYNIRIGRR